VNLHPAQAAGNAIRLCFWSLFLFGCGQESSSTRPLGAAAEIHDAFGWLLRQEGNEAFVVIEEPRSGKFVQFAGSREAPLLLDLPGQTLDPSEMDRARVLFHKLGVEGPEEWDVHDPLTGKVAGKQVGFQMKLGRDPRRAADIASRVFQEVYCFSADIKLHVSRH